MTVTYLLCSGYSTQGCLYLLGAWTSADLLWYLDFCLCWSALPCHLAAGECSTLENQLSELRASEAGLSKAKTALETKLAELEELLATTTTSRDELTGGWHLDGMVWCVLK